MPTEVASAIPGVLIGRPQVHGDDRGRFVEIYRASRMPEPFRQSNHSRSAAGVLRGSAIGLGAQGAKCRDAAVAYDEQRETDQRDGDEEDEAQRDDVARPRRGAIGERSHAEEHGCVEGADVARSGRNQRRQVGDSRRQECFRDAQDVGQLMTEGARDPPVGRGLEEPGDDRTRH